MTKSPSRPWISWTIVGLTGLISAAPAHAQTGPVCGTDVKEEVAKILTSEGAQKDPYSKEALDQQQKLYEKYQYCAADGEALAAHDFDNVSREYCGKLTYLGSTFYERMRCCGYDPQKQLFACPVEVKQTFGFGAPPFPGSFEYVLSCVDLGAGYQPAALDDVHLANAVSGGPDWYFAVIARATGRLANAQLTGKTLRARSILSWGLVPTSCNYQPIWGNAIDYQIRLDP
jgi:hypothetical protein